MTVRIGISGAAGRMGRKLMEAIIYTSEDAVLGAALESSGNPHLGADAFTLAGLPAADVLITDSFSFKASSVDVFVDFSTPAAAVELSRKCRKHGIALVVGVTGFSDDEKKELLAAAEDIPLVVEPNMSLGMNIMFNLAKEAGKDFDDKRYDIEIQESHHKYKKDAPSGTALRLGELVAEATGGNFSSRAVFARPRIGDERKEGEIGFSVVRGGDIVGEHRLTFIGLGEQLEITHRSTDRINYAIGAIIFATRIAGGRPGLYNLANMATAQDTKD